MSRTFVTCTIVCMNKWSNVVLPSRHLFGLQCSQHVQQRFVVTFTHSIWHWVVWGGSRFRDVSYGTEFLYDLRFKTTSLVTMKSVRNSIICNKLSNSALAVVFAVMLRVGIACASRVKWSLWLECTGNFLTFPAVDNPYTLVPAGKMFWCLSTEPFV